MSDKEERVSQVYGLDRKKIISMRVDEDMYVEATEVARKNGSSPGLVARVALQEYLAKQRELEGETA